MTSCQRIQFVFKALFKIYNSKARRFAFAAWGQERQDELPRLYGDVVLELAPTSMLNVPHAKGLAISLATSEAPKSLLIWLFSLAGCFFSFRWSQPLGLPCEPSSGCRGPSLPGLPVLNQNAH